MTAVAEIFQDQAGQWRWRLKATNGEIVATGEAHTSRADALRAFGDAQFSMSGVVRTDVLPATPTTTEA